MNNANNDTYHGLQSVRKERKINMKYGELLENVAYEICEHLPWFEHSSQEDDRKKGIDFYCNRIPMDITLSIERKTRNLKDKKKSFKCCESFVVNLFIRTGNKYGEYEQPVVVVQVETLNDITKSSARNIVKTMLEHNIFTDQAVDFWLENVEEE